MTEDVNTKSKEIVPEDNQEITALLKKMQKQLDSMEAKIDALTQQAKARIIKGRQFSTPYKEYDKTNRPSARRYEGKDEGVSREGKFYHGRPFNKKMNAGGSAFGGSKRPVNKSSRGKRSSS